LPNTRNQQLDARHQGAISSTNRISIDLYKR
jgi:hypothetical protein